ncbi:hypothetical protein BDZ94DRAFT_51555 [Collybia nuda]|uniref:Uncharacterized protein n=1 Tax=Collybia nuda TaxID=64659 RepID=A0A9P5YBT2_9AGAR|nr:hypothetical protein BDZ94DRAFT_51555 [Collybia nuda]
MPIHLLQQIFTSRNGSITYNKFRGGGPPPIDAGSDGDIYVNTLPNACQVFVRYESGWEEWPGIYRSKEEWKEAGGAPMNASRSYLFLHPADSSRVVWCTRSGVIWYPKSGLYCTKKILFESINFTGRSFISARELIDLKCPSECANTDTPADGEKSLGRGMVRDGAYQEHLSIGVSGQTQSERIQDSPASLIVQEGLCVSDAYSCTPIRGHEDSELSLTLVEIVRNYSLPPTPPPSEGDPSPSTTPSHTAPILYLGTTSNVSDDRIIDLDLKKAEALASKALHIRDEFMERSQSLKRRRVDLEHNERENSIRAEELRLLKKRRFSELVEAQEKACIRMRQYTQKLDETEKEIVTFETLCEAREESLIKEREEIIRIENVIELWDSF